MRGQQCVDLPENYGGNNHHTFDNSEPAAANLHKETSDKGDNKSKAPTNISDKGDRESKAPTNISDKADRESKASTARTDKGDTTS